MAQSIRISDEFYDLAQRAGITLGRSLAQQMEYWARLGAALDLAGITASQALQLLGGDAAVKAEVWRLLGASQDVPQSSADSPVIAQRHDKNDREVARGTRSPRSLLVVPKKLAKSAKLSFPADAFTGAQSW